jgi:hypothetical protein
MDDEPPLQLQTKIGKKKHTVLNVKWYLVLVLGFSDKQEGGKLCYVA